MATQIKTTWQRSKVYLLIFLAAVVIGYLGFVKSDFGSFFWSIMNNNAGAIQGISTVILVGVTAFYAFQVRKTNSLISMQIFPNIFITPSKLYSSFLDSEFIAKVKENIPKLSNNRHSAYDFCFTLNYSVSNHSASSGSIERPQLLIENAQSGKHKLLSFDAAEVVIDGASVRGEIKDTIYLRAGETKNMKDEFYFSVFCSKPLADDLDLINNASNLQYTILYKNVVGNQLSIPLTEDLIISFDNK
ncbi:MAG: hypothetical protein WAP55_01880 [Minisyncoccia bacterium]